MPKRGFGNLIALPLQGRSRRHDNATVFVNPATWEAYPDQFAYLSSLERLDRRRVLELVERLRPPVVGPAARLQPSPLSRQPEPPPVVKAELAGMLAVRRAGLPPSLLASLKHLASLHNAEFHEKQRMGFSVWNTPRFLRCYLETLEHLHLPRGVVDEARAIVEEAGSRLEITDVRPAPPRLDLAFTGTPRDASQQQAIDAMAGHDLGVLVAPPGAGKTVMACALIARHATPTLVLVDRAPLLNQWRERLHTFLGLPKDTIGQIGGGKNRRSGVVDLAMLQTLVRQDDPAALLDGYGLVVVDECHHVAAETFETAIRDIPARRWLGLTATPKRTDHRDQIMLMHCGRVRHRVTSEHDLVRTLVVHPTGFSMRDDIDGDVPGLLSSIIAPALVADEQRNAQIIDDVAGAVARGRNCLVLTGRTDHVDLLTAALRELGLDPLSLYGALKPAERLVALNQLASTVDTGPPLLVVATDKYIGEGFDCPRLDTVFLTYPLSSETPITQYVGRILREHAGKTALRYMTTPTPRSRCWRACTANG
jgi:superfamily II DNA or RNA helicase